MLMSHPCLPPLVCFARATRTATLPLRLWTRLDTQNRFIALLAKRQHRHHQDGVSRRCGGDGAPHDVSRLAMLARDVFVVAALVVLCSLLSLTGWSLQCRHGNIERLSIDFKLGCICAWSVCRRVVRQLRVNRTCTEHDDSEGQGTKIVQCSCPTLVSRLLCASLVRPEPLRCHCGHGRDLTPKPLIALLAKRQHRHHQDGVSRRCGGDGAPHDVSRLAMLARDVFVVAALVVLCSLSLTGWPLQCRHGNIERLSIDFKLGCICAWSVCRRVVRQLRVNRTCTEHDDSEGQGTKIVQCSCPTLSPASCVLRSCDPNRYVVTAAMDAT